MRRKIQRSMILVITTTLLITYAITTFVVYRQTISLMAVSYTHLDVYKRQGFSACSSKVRKSTMDFKPYSSESTFLSFSVMW